MLRGVLLFLSIAVLLVVFISALAVRSQPRAEAGWQEFAIGPAVGRNTSINPDGIRSDGMPLKLMISVAYAMPQVRIAAPAWLSENRYAVRAVISPDAGESLATLLQRELSKRLNLVTHSAAHRPRESRNLIVLSLFLSMLAHPPRTRP